MYAPGHVGLSLLAFAPLGAALLATGSVRLAASGTALSVVTATLPDLDLYVDALPHRGLTHTVLFAAFAGVFAAVVVSTYARSFGLPRRTVVRLGAFACLVLVGSVASHLVGDLVTPMGVWPFAPVSDRHVTLSLVAARDPTANASLFVAGTSTTASYWWRSVEGASVRKKFGETREYVVGLPFLDRFGR
jgi:inner membrane protein